MATVSKQYPVAEWLRIILRGDEFGNYDAGGLPLPGAAPRAGVPITFREAFSGSRYWTGSPPDFGDSLGFAREYFKTTDDGALLARLRAGGYHIGGTFDPATGQVTVYDTNNPSPAIEGAIMAGLAGGVLGLAFAGAGIAGAVESALPIAPAAVIAPVAPGAGLTLSPFVGDLPLATDAAASTAGAAGSVLGQASGLFDQVFKAIVPAAATAAVRGLNSGKTQPIGTGTVAPVAPAAPGIGGLVALAAIAFLGYKALS